MASSDQVIYGKRPVAEAERGRRRVHRVWRAPETSAEELERLCGSPDHQGVVAEVDPYPYADRKRCCAVENALIVALDQVQDPRNLGAVCRSAEVAGAAGVVIPERRSAEVTAVACKASAGAVEHLSIARVRNLADWLGEAKQAGFWIWGADAGARAGSLGCRPQRPTVLVLGGEGSGHPAAGGIRLRRARRPAAARQDRLAQRLGRGRGAALRGRSPALLSPWPVATATAVARNPCRG